MYLILALTRAVKTTCHYYKPYNYIVANIKNTRQLTLFYNTGLAFVSYYVV